MYHYLLLSVASALFAQISSAAPPDSRRPSVLDVFDDGQLLLSVGHAQTPIEIGTKVPIYRPNDNPRQSKFIGTAVVVGVGVNYSVARFNEKALKPAIGDSVYLEFVEVQKMLELRGSGRFFPPRLHHGAIIEGKLPK